jgi:hypothetical protein
MHKELTQVPRKIAIENLLEQWRMTRPLERGLTSCSAVRRAR